jgi:hypothetical protein
MGGGSKYYSGDKAKPWTDASYNIINTVAGNTHITCDVTLQTRPGTTHTTLLAWSLLAV